MLMQYSLPVQLPTQKAPGLVQRLGPLTMQRDRRPHSGNHVIKHAAAEEILPEVLAWLDLPADTDQSPHILATLIDIAKTCKDGYELAKELDRKHWSTDSELVEIMDHFSDLLSQAHRELIRAWVKEFAIAPDRHLGDEVAIKTWVEDGKGRSQLKTVAGVITRIDEADASYLVLCPELGHVREGFGTHGFVVPYEQTLDRLTEAA